MSGSGLDFDTEQGEKQTSCSSSTAGILCERKAVKYGQLDSEANEGLTPQINIGFIFGPAQFNKRKDKSKYNC